MYVKIHAEEGYNSMLSAMRRLTVLHVFVADDRRMVRSETEHACL